MKKIIALLLALCMTMCMFAGCGNTAAESAAPASSAEAVSASEAAAPAEETPAEETEVIVFAAASMTETLTEIAEQYKQVAPNVKLTFNFDSSGTLLTQIKEGADCDVFISAAPKQMNALDGTKDAEGGNEDGTDMLVAGSRINLLENKVVLAVPEGNAAGIQSYDDLNKGLQDGSVMLAMGNSDVPVGQYTQKILAYYELNEEDLAAAGSITYGSNVKEVTTQVSEATVDAGIIYATDAYSAGLTVVDTATPEMCGQVIYPAAVLNITKAQDEAQAFLDYLTTADASAVFEKVGFTPLTGADDAAPAAPAAAAADAEEVELVVFAAASMTETLQAIAELYKTVAPNVTLTFNFDSSGTLLTQIKEGADCDVFISAAPKQMNALDGTRDADGGNEDGTDMLVAGSRCDLLENKVVLAVPEGNPAGIEGYDDLAAKLADGSVFLAMGNSDVPVGQYTQKILAYYELNEEDLAAAGTITYGSNVKEVTTQVSEAAVDCGIIYATDAFSAGLESVEAATAEMCGQVIYPASVLNISANQEAAQAFLDFLKTAECSAVFEGVGFTALS